MKKGSSMSRVPGVSLGSGWRSLWCLAVLSSALLAPGNFAQAQPGAGKIDPWVFENTRAGAEAEFLVVLAEQADLSGAAALRGKLAKGHFVYQALMKTAQETQGPLLAELELRGAEYRSFYLVNAIWVKGDRGLALALAARADVARIDGNPEMRQAIPEPHEPLPLEFNPEWSEKAILAAEPGISYVRAPQVWGLGYTGQGIVVGGADTGYRWTHAALKNMYRGWNGTTASHDYNWHDSIHSGGGVCGANSTRPATTTATAPTPWAPRWAPTAPTRSVWRRARSGSAAAT